MTTGLTIRGYGIPPGHASAGTYGLLPAGATGWRRPILPRMTLASALLLRAEAKSRAFRVMRDRFVDLSAGDQGISEVVVGLSEAGLDFHGAAIMGDRLVDLSARGQGVSQVVVRLR